MAAASGVSPSSLLRLPSPHTTASSSSALLQHREPLLSLATVPPRASFTAAPSGASFAAAAAVDSSNGNDSYSGNGLNLMETVSTNEDTGKGAMWQLEKSLNQPMDAEAGRLRNMYREKVIAAIIIQVFVSFLYI
ncbi:hypothetical protein ZWY2020_004273 [Hordeum vulgare]|nr:hypothetical protein ZWY2020_004273 [Hordeum vulgare]